MLKCGDGSLYTGWTNDIEKRMSGHRSGKGSKYTRSRLPVHLVYIENFSSKPEAMRRECEIKKLNRSEKRNLVENYLSITNGADTPCL